MLSPIALRDFSISHPSKPEALPEPLSPRSLTPDVVELSNLDLANFVLSRPKAPGMKLDTEGDWPHDGCFVGANGKLYPATTPVEEIPPVLPDNGKEPQETLYLVNGIMTDVALQASDMQRLANSGYRVVGIHNATKGLFMDLSKCLGDKLDLDMANDRSIDTAEALLRQSVAEGKPMHFVGHSKGALILSCAVKRVRQHLLDEGCSAAEAERKLSHVKVTSLGGAAYSYPDGPNYTHYVNHCDLVPMATGIGAVSWLTAGDNDRIVRFNEINAPHDLPSLSDGTSNYFARVVDRSVHGPQDVYIPHLKESAPKVLAMVS